MTLLVFCTVRVRKASLSKRDIRVGVYEGGGGKDTSLRLLLRRRRRPRLDFEEESDALASMHGGGRSL